MTCSDALTRQGAATLSVNRMLHVAPRARVSGDTAHVMRTPAPVAGTSSLPSRSGALRSVTAPVAERSYFGSTVSWPICESVEWTSMSKMPLIVALKAIVVVWFGLSSALDVVAVDVDLVGLRRADLEADLVALRVLELLDLARLEHDRLAGGGAELESSLPPPEATITTTATTATTTAMARNVRRWARLIRATG